MIVLDFSNQKFDSLHLENEWEREISVFLDQWNSDSDFVLAKTSGSTGLPKEIKLPKSAMRLSASMTGEFFGLKNGNSALLCLPMGFIAGKMMVVRAQELGLKLYCTEPKSEINLYDFPELDFVPMTPMQVEKSIGNLGKIKKLLIGGAPLSDELRSRLLETNTRVFESYGMTETITHIGLKEITEDYFRTLKKVKIRKDERGCLVIQTPYFEEEITTNDLVEIKGENQFKWLGRFDSIINSGGIKLIPEQIEQKLKAIIPIEFILSSLPDSTLGEKLILILENPEPIDVDFASLELSKYEIPKEIFYLNRFPRTESGKLKRKEILAQIKK